MAEFKVPTATETTHFHPKGDNKGAIRMAVHHGGKVGKAAKTLASKHSSNKAKSSAGKTLANHKAAKH